MGLSGEFLAAFAGESAAPTRLDELLRRLEREEFDLVAVGRALLADPQWAAKIQRDDLAALHGFSPPALGELT